MSAQQSPAIQLQDFGDATIETRQIDYWPQYPDHIYGRGPFPGWLECAADHPVDLPTL
jgi:hypothetical protein